MVRRRRRWRVWQRYMDPARFVFLDETGVTTKMTRLYGRAQRGERLVDAVPHGHWRTTTLIAGLRQSGVIAPMVLDGPMTGAAFRAYVEQALAPVLQSDDVVVMDNLAAHKVAPASKRQLPPPGPAFSTCRPTGPISTRSSSSSPSSRRSLRSRDLRLSGWRRLGCAETCYRFRGIRKARFDQTGP